MADWNSHAPLARSMAQLSHLRAPAGGDLRQGAKLDYNFANELAAKAGEKAPADGAVWQQFEWCVDELWSSGRARTPASRPNLHLVGASSPDEL